MAASGGRYVTSSGNSGRGWPGSALDHADAPGSAGVRAGAGSRADTIDAAGLRRPAEARPGCVAATRTALRLFHVKRRRELRRRRLARGRASASRESIACRQGDGGAVGPAEHFQLPRQRGRRGTRRGTMRPVGCCPGCSLIDGGCALPRPSGSAPSTRAFRGTHRSAGRRPHPYPDPCGRGSGAAACSLRARAAGTLLPGRGHAPAPGRAFRRTHRWSHLRVEHHGRASVWRLPRGRAAARSPDAALREGRSRRGLQILLPAPQPRKRAAQQAGDRSPRGAPSPGFDVAPAVVQRLALLRSLERRRRQRVRVLHPVQRSAERAVQHGGGCMSTSGIAGEDRCGGLFSVRRPATPAAG